MRPKRTEGLPISLPKSGRRAPACLVWVRVSPGPSGSGRRPGRPTRSGRALPVSSTQYLYVSGPVRLEAPPRASSLGGADAGSMRSLALASHRADARSGGAALAPRLARERGGLEPRRPRRSASRAPALHRSAMRGSGRRTSGARRGALAPGARRRLRRAPFTMALVHARAPLAGLGGVGGRGARGRSARWRRRTLGVRAARGPAANLQGPRGPWAIVAHAGWESLYARGAPYHGPAGAPFFAAHLGPGAPAGPW